MAVKAGEVLRLLTSFMGGVLGGAAQGIATGFGGTGTGLASRVLAGASPYTVAEYPDRKNPFIYDVEWKAPPEGKRSADPDFNSEYKKHPYPRFMRMQTLDEHNRALNKYIRPGMTPLQQKEAIRRGIEEEKKLESYWTNDDKPRSDKVKSSSSAVSDVHVNPDGTISVRFRQQGKWYTYGGGPTSYDAALAANDLVTANSMGKAINKKTGWWSVGNNHKLW